MVPSFTYSVPTNLRTTAWVKEHFTFRYLSSSRHSEKPFDGLDTLLLLSWVCERFARLEDQPFVIHYWDLRMPNIMVDDDENLVAQVPITFKLIAIEVSLIGMTPDVYR